MGPYYVGWTRVEKMCVYLFGGWREDHNSKSWHLDWRRIDECHTVDSDENSCESNRLFYSWGLHNYDQETLPARRRQHSMELLEWRRWCTTGEGRLNFYLDFREHLTHLYNNGGYKWMPATFTDDRLVELDSSYENSNRKSLVRVFVEISGGFDRHDSFITGELEGHAGVPDGQGGG